MQTITLAAAESSAGNPILNIAVFAAFLVVTMYVVLRAGKSTKEASDFYTGGGSFSGRQNGLAISGDYLSAASFLGIVGAVALNGYDGFLYSVGFFVAWLVALMLVAEPMRNVGRFTMADVLSFRLKQRPVRVAAAISTLFVSLFYLIAQMAGAGSLVAVLLNIHEFKWQAVVVGIVGILMIVYVLVGGMKGTTYVQMIKAVLLVTGVVIMCILTFVMLKGGFNTLFSTAVDMHASSAVIQEKGYEASQIMEPGLKYGKNLTTKLDFISLGIALVLGVGGLPHVLMRFYTVPTATEARRSVTWAIVIIGAFYLMTLILGYGAAALVGPDRILAAPGGANSAAPLLALEIGGSVFMAVISAVAFATVLAVVAGLAITASASIAHDVYHSVIRNGESTEAEQVRVSQITVVILGIASIILGILAMTQNVAFLVSLAFAVAASANLPTILYSLYWRRFNTAGAVASMYTGVISCLVLIFLSPAVSGTPTSMFPNADWSIFPLSSPGLVTIPLAFFAGWIVSIMTPPDNLEELSAEMEVRSLTGVGVEAPVDH
ncbi:solute symporter family protein [Corynebacterium minutissimum]|uniref:Cation acetate symporter n=1 Tax=Corynebacterium minutissimum TaxID=38301 RepID=A0A2X4RTA1_9CORY|nr:cation acetate symporter [Corynebacterium minutissimum]KHO29832.1 acetate permease [Corynebacterium minutissimum]MCG7229264.1 cation acetate symporter [Corynebacterium minutissimum]MCG7238254.1 cation acetate symporter [Corynebacterium minutissimum]QPS60665.1 cation acetate symporter [Corynebacterium minutissimum]QQA78548.1 cation acetate symporter [Corynebacterium minutissimum]